MIPALPGDIFHESQVLNNTWTIQGVLGRGGTGEVYRAKSLVTGRVVAIKALAAPFSGDEGYLELMRREEAMRDILHDAVVRYSDCSRTPEGHVFLVMDFIDGPALSEVMAERRPGMRELLIVAHRVAEGLVAAHARGVVHRDLSPDNVILRDGRVEGATVIDFGIAKDTAAGARTVVGNQFAGKYEYAAPEQFEGKAEPASDLYALGALLLAAARGEVPFAGATPGEMIRRKAEPLDVSGLPEPLAGLILWLSAPRIAERAPSAAAVVARLDKLLKGGEAAPARKAAAPQPNPSPQAGGGRGRIWLGLILLVLVLAGGFLALKPLLAPDLPLVQPWRLEAADGEAPRLTGPAPDDASATRIAAAFAAATGTNPPQDALTQARGMPAPGWAGAVEQLFPRLQELQDWTVLVTDMQVEITGRAATQAGRDAIAARTRRMGASGGYGADAPAYRRPRPVGPRRSGRDTEPCRHLRTPEQRPARGRRPSRCQRDDSRHPARSGGNGRAGRGIAADAWRPHPAAGDRDAQPFVVPDPLGGGGAARRRHRHPAVRGAPARALVDRDLSARRQPCGRCAGPGRTGSDSRGPSCGSRSRKPGRFSTCCRTWPIKRTGWNASASPRARCAVSACFGRSKTPQGGKAASPFASTTAISARRGCLPS
ncbi:serine/threonine-protein kinase [Paracoccus sp. (in: a-proteobacteria)]|uniref:serine/threonine-protein kinase n=1 Tax=Paracoccus sp. TaxID=267 RepID=UPI002AFE3114|nr:serine/threonine-protein kinase [Paracoccus sp. (in: a-proteobacteria)]